MSRWRRLRCRSAIHFLEIKSEIKSERLREREKKSEIPLCSCARCGDNDVTSSLRACGDMTIRGFGLLGLVLVHVLGIFFFFFFFDKHLCALCLVCFCIGVWSLCQRRCDVMRFCQAPATWWVFSVFFFFWLRIRGLGLPWAWFCYFYFILFFQILVQIFFGFFFFFFCLKV